MDVFDRLGRPRILVLGDMMLDRYTWGRAARTSQEAPVLVLQADRREHRPGGAANVALMLQVLEADVACVGIVGNDDAGSTLRQLLDDAQIDVTGLVQVAGRPTTLKERFVGRSGSGLPSQMLRVDTEVTAEIASETEDHLVELLEQLIPEYDAVLISDYNKGVCTPRCLRTTIRIAKEQEIPILVDPGRARPLELYRGATLIKPNRQETVLATGQQVERCDDAIRIGFELCQRFDFGMTIITLDAEGMVLAERDGFGKTYPTRARSVYDITGAGDMVLAMLGLSLAARIRPEYAVQLANTAAGLEVDRTGVCPLTRAEIRAELESHQLNSRRKICTLDQLARMTEEYRLRGQRVALTNGCFDLLHVGHASYLEEAAAHGDVLIVAINSDDSVRRLKGPERPVIKQHERAAMLAALGCVDHVVVFGDDTPHALLTALRPDVLVKGGTYTLDEVVGREIVEAYGGRVCLAGYVPGVSTTEIVQSVRQKATLKRAG